MREEKATVRTVKGHLAKELATLSAPRAIVASFSTLSILETVDYSAVDVGSIRLDHSLHHTPYQVPNQRRRRCIVHSERKDTPFFCGVCGVHLCLGKCWELFHFHEESPSGLLYRVGKRRTEQFE